MLFTNTHMALPAVTKLSECADFSKTVKPYLPQLYTFANDAAASITNPEALKQVYITTNPLISALALTIATFPIFLLVSEFNRNYSQVDRVWSILPTVYHAHWAIWARLNGLPTQRVDNVLAVGVVWSLRLTYNYWRRGGYQVGSEDYRWLIIKKNIGGFGFFLLNLVFISTLQLILLLAVTTPGYVMLLTSRIAPEMTYVDAIFSRSLMALVVFEYFADQQQWDYHKAKHSYQATAKVPQGWTRAQMDRGFITTGLWKWSRHPNFAAEQTIWVVHYAWGCYQSQTYVNWTCGGMIAYLLVFQGSTPITEWISASKYPEYALYQKKVGRFLPNLGGGWSETDMEQVEAKSNGSKDKKGAAKKKT